VAAPPPIRVMWWGPQRRRGWAFRDPSCETARFPGLAVCPSAGLRHSPSIRVPSEATTALFAKCLWCSAMSPEPTFTLQCEEPKHPEPKHHPVGLPAGSPSQTPSAAMRRAPGAEALVDNEAHTCVRAARPPVRAHECAWSQNTQSQNTRSGCPQAALLRRQARP
jgi:hypothetical protein